VPLLNQLEENPRAHWLLARRLLAEQRHFRLQLTVKGGQHRQAAMGQTLGLEGNGEKLKARTGCWRAGCWRRVISNSSRRTGHETHIHL
jgi:hypothetical protein